MTESLQPIRPEDEDNLLAAEYVSGLLDLAERVAVETRARNDAVFASLITEWENRLSDLNDDYTPAPAPNLLPQIEARLFPTAPRRSLLSNLWAWGAAAGAALAVVAYLALTPAAPSFTATLANDAGTLRYEAVITQDRLTITRVAGDGADATHAHELWFIAGDNPPVSLGVIPDTGTTLSLPGVSAGAVLAVTVEPAGGSPTGQPTTTPIAVGKLTEA
jgi:anti-sigma-K factor RskA